MATGHRFKGANATIEDDLVCRDRFGRRLAWGKLGRREGDRKPQRGLEALKIAKHNKLLVKQIEPFMAQLPSDFLLKYATTQDLIKKWLEGRSHALWLGKCLKARFGGGGGNPAKKALLAKLIDEVEYKTTMAFVEFEVTLFAVIQIAWEEIREGTSCIEGSPRSEIAMYLEILRDRYDGKFLKAVKGCKETVSKMESKAKIARNAIWSHRKDPGWDGTLTPEQSAYIDSLISPNSDFSWLPLVLNICKEAANQDNEIRRILRKLLDDFSYLCDLIVQAAREERSSNPPKRFQSQKWEDGRLYAGTKGGFLPVTEVNEPLSVTELNKTISDLVQRTSQE